MNILKKIKHFYSKISEYPFFSPQGFFVRGAELSVIFFICQLLGWKKYVGALFGTTYAGNLTFSVYFLRFAGMLYGFFYFAFLLLAPVFLIASLLLYVFLRFTNTPRS